jgi:carbonic anhydrase
MAINRRDFSRLGVLGGSAGLLPLGLSVGVAAAAGATEALLMTCMDFRLIDETERYMTGRGLRDKYDQIILAGASLGAVTEKYPAWNTTFWEHLALGLQLHHIRTVIVMDHRDCGAYKLILGADFVKDRAKETAIHTEKLRAIRTQVAAKHPTLKVELLLMNLDGTVETIR